MEVPKSLSHERTLIKFWGVRGSIPAPGSTSIRCGGNTPCVEIRADGELIILDAGSGIRGLGHALLKEFGEGSLNINLLMTHTHWDHIQGFPFFQPAYDKKNRIRISGFPARPGDLAYAFETQMSPVFFPVSMKQMAADIEMIERADREFSIGKIGVASIPVNHPGGCSGYRLRSTQGAIVFISDFDPAGWENPENPLLEFVRDADVLICDAQYSTDEYQDRPGWGHACIDDIIHLAIKAGVRRLFLFHYDPIHSDDEMECRLQGARGIVSAAGADLQVDLAREGAEIFLSEQ